MRYFRSQSRISHVFILRIFCFDLFDLFLISLNLLHLSILHILLSPSLSLSLSLAMKNTCGLCGRRFANGRALGGHMRSHVMSSAKAQIVPVSPSSASSAAAEDGTDPCYRPEFSTAAGSTSIVQDVESDAESSVAPSLPRTSKRARRWPSPEPISSSSVSDATPEAEVARCLMMLSRDAWTRSQESEDDPDDDDNDDRLAGKSPPPPRQVARPRKYQCGTCKKVFPSYQALGGHRAGRKKLRESCAPPTSAQFHGGAASAPPAHQCPFCFRVFRSGQALGGHKKSHFTAPPPPPPPSPPRASNFADKKTRRYPSAPKLGNCSIDLNLPAPASV